LGVASHASSTTPRDAKQEQSVLFVTCVLQMKNSEENGPSATCAASFFLAWMAKRILRVVTLANLPLPQLGVAQAVRVEHPLQRTLRAVGALRVDIHDSHLEHPLERQARQITWMQ
jgi:hypothetical protein